MGRRKRDYPTGTLRMIAPKNVNKTKLYPIAYEYSWNREIIRRTTNISAKYDDWNPNACQLRASFGNRYKEYNNLFADNIKRYDLQLSQFQSKHPNRSLTAEDVRDILFDKPLYRNDEGRDFKEYVLQNLQSRLNSNKIKRSRYENGISAMKGFSEFLKIKGLGTYKDDGIYLGEISPELIDKYIEYRKDKGNSNATINHTLTPIFVALEEASALGYISTATYSVIKNKRLEEDAVSSFESDNERFDGKYLTEAELKALIKYYEEDTEPRRKEFIEMYLFALNAGGLRLVDVMTLRWCDVDFEKNEISKYLIKTIKHATGRHIVPLTQPALAILNKWKNKTAGHKFVFDLAKDDLNLDDSRALYLVEFPHETEPLFPISN